MEQPSKTPPPAATGKAKAKAKAKASKRILAHAALRGLTFLASAATVVLAMYGSGRYHAAKEFIGSFVAALWTMFLDGTIIAMLLQKTRRLRIHPGWLIVVELLTAVLCIIAPFMIGTVDRGFVFECGGSPREECDARREYRTRADVPLFGSCFLQWAVGGLHFLFTFLACSSRCSAW